MTKPIIHLNGTHPKDLLEGYLEAMSKLSDALEAMQKAGPNGRDYYPMGDTALRTAQAEHEERLKVIAKVRDEMEALAVHVSEMGGSRL